MALYASGEHRNATPASVEHLFDRHFESWSSGRAGRA
jgi:hypothetical protein